YNPVNTTVNIGAGSTSTTVSVGVNGDNVYEPNESFRLVITGAIGANAGLGASGTITNDDPIPTVNINTSTTSQSEGNAGASVQWGFQITLSNPSFENITVNWGTQDGSATGGPDYGPASGSVTFTPGQTTQTVIVNSNGDDDIEGDETFSVNISVASGSATVGSGSVTVTILDDD
ncbi:MAG TPA: Calx-beta domain-containing protein, partial [Aggregatilineales bacterium]|nr:Calx-beta domain-containing protein [Aggregatilineales bacterium]